MQGGHHASIGDSLSGSVYTKLLGWPSKMPTCATITLQDNQVNSHDQLKSKLPPVPDLNNRRYCRACQCTLPLSAFPSGTRRFLCKRHIWQRIQQPSKQRAMANNSHKRRLWTLWKKCWTDAKRTFKHDRILLLQRDIQETLAQLVDSSNDGCREASCPGLLRDSTADAQPTSDRNPPSPPDVQITVQKDSELDIALMPSNPQHPLSRDNVVVVDKNARRVLLRAFRLGGANKYISELGAMD